MSSVSQVSVGEVVALRRIAVGRMIGLIFGCVSLVVSVMCFHSAYSRNLEFNEWIVARPMETVIDLSKPGEVTVPFRQTCRTSHEKALNLEGEFDEEFRSNLNKSLTGLSGTAIVEDLNGQEVVRQNFTLETARLWGDKIMINMFDPFRLGEFRVTVRVDSGAEKLSEVPHSICAMYQLCGLEEMPVLIDSFVGFVSGGLASICLLSIAPGIRRLGVWKHEPVVESPMVVDAEEV